LFYKRHTNKCGQADRFYRRCHCPCWVEGVTNDGVYIRRSLKLVPWERAEKRRREIEQGAQGIEKSPDRKFLIDATGAFLQEASTRNLNRSTLSKYKLLFSHLNQFAQARRLAYLDELNHVETLREFRARWKDAPRTAGKKLERLRSFFGFAIENDWIAKNAAKLLKPSLVKDKPTLPYDGEQMARILEHAGDDDELDYTFVLAMRYTGMRISDCALLKATSVSVSESGSRIFLHMAKTGVPVYVPIPESLAHRLAAITPRAGYLFLRGQSTKLETCADLWRRRLARIFKAAKISNGHPHRFRDTFAVSLLEQGVPIETVSMLLGHSSIKVTEKHYAPWVNSRQLKLEEDVRKTWGEASKIRS
jgi:site-specific recombinase XerD